MKEIRLQLSNENSKRIMMDSLSASPVKEDDF